MIYQNEAWITETNNQNKHKKLWNIYFIIIFIYDTSVSYAVLMIESVSTTCTGM